MTMMRCWRAVAGAVALASALSLPWAAHAVDKRPAKQLFGAVTAPSSQEPRPIYSVRDACKTPRDVV